MGTSQSSIDLEHEDSNEIRRDIRSTRSRMDETLDELGERLSPHHLLDDVLDVFRGAGGKKTAARAGETVADVGESLGRTIRDNPVPTLLIGAGLAWLAFGPRDRDNSRGSDEMTRRLDGRYRTSAYEVDELYGEEPYDEWEGEVPRQTYAQRSPLVIPESYGSRDEETSSQSSWSDTAAHAKEGVTGAASKAGGTVSDAASTAGETLKSAGQAVKGAGHAVSDAAARVASGISGVGHATTETAGRAYRGSRRAGQQAYRYGGQSRRAAARQLSRGRHQLGDLYEVASDRYHDASREYPLAVGMGCLALGMLAGLVIPRTRREDEWMGEQSDELFDEAWHAGESLLEQGQQVVSEAVHSASESAGEHGLSPDSLLERGKRVVSKAASAAADAAKEEGLDPQHLTEDVKAVGKSASGKLKEGAEKATDTAKKKAEKVDPDLSSASDKASGSQRSNDLNRGNQKTTTETGRPSPK